MSVEPFNRLVKLATRGFYDDIPTKEENQPETGRSDYRWRDCCGYTRCSHQTPVGKRGRFSKGLEATLKATSPDTAILGRRKASN
ncbi:hypothetical protein RHGRI_013818 [Rhododendron griersonianum]|uniref:Uncharacterized protein n=1 Tax=Rhododendron griersonianum TaxID=479676 RepID=A0AAV6K7A3_9ERIC|nr:hypothetical protein RHGRI_013818 [Rhododendron griersonianum]